MNDKKGRLDSLRLAIGSQIKPPVPQHTTPAAQRQPAAPAEQKPRAAERPKRQKSKPQLSTMSGRGMQFYLEDTDRKIIRSIAGWFMAQDRRMSDSQVVKTALRLAAAQQSNRLLELGDEVRAGDRRHHHRTGTSKDQK
jgi:hypothetical protein